MTYLTLFGAMGLLAVWATWPLPICFSQCLVDPGVAPPLVAPVVRRDVDLTLWILAWTTHALTTDPARLFDANVFHPAPATLTASEHLLGALPIALPLALATGDLVIAHQGTFFATFVLSGFALAALVQRWTGSFAAAFAAGAAYAYSPFRLGHVAVLTMAGVQYLPLVVLAAERTLASPARARWAVALTLLVVVQALHSYYLAYATFVMLGVLAAVVLAADRSARARWGWIAGAFATAACAVALVSLPYFAARHGGALEPPNPAFVRMASAQPGRLGASVTTLVALATLPFWRRGIAGRVGGVWLAALAVMTVACHLLALGPEIRVWRTVVPGPFALGAAVVPGWSLVRAPMRLSAPAVAGVCALAGIGVAGVLAGLGRRRRLGDAVVVVLAMAFVGATVRRPLVAATAETPAMVPAVYRWLATAPAGPLVEIPFHPFRLVGAGRDVEARRTARSIVHWQPMLGGYSGYAPPTYAAVSALVQALPDPHAARLLARTTGLRWIVLHRDEMDATARRAWARARADYLVVARFGRDVVLRVRDAPSPDLLAAFVADEGTATPLGTSRAPIPPDDRVATLDVARSPARAPWLAPIAIAVTVRNDGRTTWPALGAAPRGLVTLGTRWIDVAGGVQERADAGRLPWDLPADAAAIAHVVVEPPRRGTRLQRLEIGVVQDGQWFAGVATVCFDGSGVTTPCGAGGRLYQRRRQPTSARRATQAAMTSQPTMLAAPPASTLRGA